MVDDKKEVPLVGLATYGDTIATNSLYLYCECASTTKSNRLTPRASVKAMLIEVTPTKLRCQLSPLE